MFQKMFDGNKDLVLVFGTILILAILFSPIPPAMLDFAIIVNFGLGFTILLLTFYVAKPVEFSTFPSILLVATLFRLSLNVAATRLILTGADAGEVIDSIGSYAVQGNFVIGLVVFAILVVVQYVVVTSGAQRVSEVAARFTLDSMPGQQMSIDADLNLGLIDQEEAQARREELEKEASFYGSMDGASKFVKGDAIAGIIILLIDIIAGLIVGVAQMGMSWGEALQRFTLLTIGDGIATQLPALIIAVATGIIVTRSSADRQLSTEIFSQLSSVPRIPLIVAIILMVMMLLPGMPKWPIAIVGVAAFAAWIRIRNVQRAEESDKAQEDQAEETSSVAEGRVIELKMGGELMAEWKDRQTLLLDRIGTQRKTIERSFGLSHPKVSIVEDNDLGGNDYQIAIHNDVYGTGQIQSERVLALKQGEHSQKLEGIPGRDPAFGLEGVWIEPGRAEEAREASYSVVDPETVITTHLNEVIKAEIPALLTRAATVELLDQVRSRQPGLIEELVPNVMTASDVQRVLQNLLQERVSIANIDIILETLVDIGRQERDPVLLSEKIRQSLSVSICSALRGHHPELAVLSLDPRVENRIVSQLVEGSAENLIASDPRLAEQLLKSLAPLVDKMIRQGRNPVLLCAAPIRRGMVRLAQRTIPQLSVISVDEVPMRVALSSFDIVKLQDEKSPEAVG
ncbi:flagellar biosynthesis protein FlhA [Qipengyuania sp. DGS5-3]|uniref:flagellar biosynthesis protein FlhA n=1 Tax=Qipengyuania sp. DGS5-3 TaxID=3349632 RepID=UPI0036D27B8A